MLYKNKEEFNMESKNFQIAGEALNNIYAILEELNAEIENLPGNVRTVPLFQKIDKIYDNLQNIKFFLQFK